MDRPGFAEWMMKIKNIYYASTDLMTEAFEKLEENEEI